jgi:hypothetical protein
MKISVPLDQQVSGEHLISLLNKVIAKGCEEFQVETSELCLNISITKIQAVQKLGIFSHDN